jgi:tetratricopeptide (TPR) repeat protein
LLKAQNPKAISLLREYRTRVRSLRAGTENEWKQLFDRAIAEIKDGNCRDALRDFEQVAGLYSSDSTSEDRSLLNLYAGECYEKERLYAKAREHYSQRLSEQHLELNRILREIAAGRGVPLIDVQELLAAHAEHGIVGYENFFVDEAHLTIKGYTLIGMRLAEEICRRGYIQKGELLCNLEAPTVASRESKVDDEIFDTAQSHTSLGWSAFQQGRFAEAIVHGKRALEKDTTALQAHLLLGYAYTKTGRLDEARKEWDHLRRLWRRGTS